MARQNSHRIQKRRLIMVDYYSILARAIWRLATNNTQARQELYEQARAILVAHLDRSGPQISTQEAIGERIAFEAAVLRAEAIAQSIGERSDATLTTRLDALHELHVNEEPTRETIPDFASLLREPAENWLALPT
jgi:hypothetical protein